MLRWIALTAAFVAYDRPVDAFRSSCLYDGWGVVMDTALPRHPRVVFYMDARNDSPSVLIATIGHKPVATKIAWTSAPPFKVATIEIDSDRTGALELAWKLDAGMYITHPAAHYAIDAQVAMPAAIHGTTSRFHRAYTHSTVHESWDGLAVTVDTTVIAFSVRWRRDANDPWQTLVVPGATLEDGNVLHLGEISCLGNFSVPLLERGIDLEVSAQLPDGTWMKVTGLPAHVVLPKLAPGTAVSRP